MKRRLPDDLGPFTLEEAEQRLSKVDDAAWLAQSRSSALEFVLGNLLIALSDSKTINGAAFVQRLLNLVPVLDASTQISAKLMLEHFLEVLSAEQPGDTKSYVLH